MIATVVAIILVVLLVLAMLPDVRAVVREWFDGRKEDL